MYDYFKIEKHQYITKVIINRPEKRNAMNRKFFTELNAIFNNLSADKDTRVILITGTSYNGSSFFSSGIDINELAEKSTSSISEMKTFGKELQESISSIEKIEKPVIALINGYCYGSGFELALACDFRITTKIAQIGLLETNIGLIPDLGGTTRLVKIVGTNVAKKVILLADKYTSDEAYKLGLVDWIVEEEELENKGLEVAHKLLNNAPLAIGVAKRIIDQIYSQTQETGLLIEQLAQLELLKSEDAKEAFIAKLEKRKPEFKGL
ncbi:MAG: enoyl-CoA hydratase/isomerase family protein [Candidatus Thorarchaeota archaeon]